jgi:hypothetical protein
MPITNPEAVDFGYLVAFAEGMYVQGSTTPHDNGRAAAAGWDIVGHLIARDSILPPMSSLRPHDQNAGARRPAQAASFLRPCHRNEGADSPA